MTDVADSRETLGTGKLASVVQANFDWEATDKALVLKQAA